MKLKGLKLVLVALLSVLVLLPFIPVKAAETGIAYYIAVNTGEDASTEIGFNWHTLVEGTKLQLTVEEDEDYSEMTEYAGECAALDYQTIVTGFNDNAYRCQVSVDGLTPGQDYRYRVGDGTTWTESHHFATAAGEGDWSFIAIADSQVYGTGYHKSYVHVTDSALAKAAELGLNPKLLIGLGDMVENGYQGEHWSYLWDNDILKKMQFSYVVGNHEYVSKELGPKWDDRFYVSMYNNPKNGPEHYQNSAYYFRYNDALFVVWNPFNYSHFSEQAAWLDEVLSTQKAKYVFVLSHYPFGGGVDSVRMNETVLPIVTKHGVDLVMSGHNHSYAYYDNYTKAPAEESFDHLLIANCDRRDYNHAVYSLINVTSTTITVSNYSYDNKLVAEYKIYARRPNTEDISTSVDKEALADSFKLELVPSDSKLAKLTWDSENAYGNIKKVFIYRDDALACELVPYSTIVNSRNIDGNVVGSTHNYKLVFEFLDGTKLERNLTFTPQELYGTLDNVEFKDGKSKYTITYTPNLIASKLKNLKVYVNDTFNQDVPLTSKNIRIDLTAFVEGQVNTIKVYGLTKDNKEVLIFETTYGNVDPVLTLDKTSVTLEEGKEETVTATVDLEGYTVEWKSSDESIATVENGKIVAKKAGTAVITAQIKDTEVKAEINLTVTAKPLPQLTVSKDAVTLEEGKEETVTATVDLEGYTVEWKSSDESIATVENGKIVAKKAGTAVITAQIKDTEIKAEINVTVNTAKAEQPKSGCNAATIIPMLAAFGLVAVFLRRKRLF